MFIHMFSFTLYHQTINFNYLSNEIYQAIKLKQKKKSFSKRIAWQDIYFVLCKNLQALTSREYIREALFLIDD